MTTISTHDSDTEKSFLTLLQSSGDAVILSDEKRRITSVNSFLCSRTGFREKELLDQKLNFLFSKENQARYIATIHKDLYRDKSWSGELEYRTKNGVTFWMATTVVARFNDRGKFVGSMMIGRDLTPERLLMQRQWETPEQAQMIIDSLGDGITICDRNGKILMCNPAYRELVGYRTEEIVGVKPPYAWIDSSEVDKVRSAFRVLQREGKLRNYVMRWRARNGHPVIVSVSVAPLLGKKEEAFAITVRNVTEVQYAYDVQRLMDQVQRLQAEVKRKAVRLGTLEAINAFVLKNADVRKIFKEVTSGIRTLVDHDLAGIYLFDPDKQHFYPHSLSRQTPFSRKLARFPLKLGEGIIGSAAVSGQMVVVNHAQRDPRSRYPEAIRPEVEHFIAVPLRGRTTTFGILVVARNRDPEFIEEEAQIVKSFADATTVAFENARLYYEMNHQTTPTFLAPYIEGSKVSTITSTSRRHKRKSKKDTEDFSFPAN